MTPPRRPRRSRRPSPYRRADGREDERLDLPARYGHDPASPFPEIAEVPDAPALRSPPSPRRRSPRHRLPRHGDGRRRGAGPETRRQFRAVAALDQSRPLPGARLRSRQFPRLDQGGERRQAHGVAPAGLRFRPAQRRPLGADVGRAARRRAGRLDAAGGPAAAGARLQGGGRSPSGAGIARSAGRAPLCPRHRRSAPERGLQSLSGDRARLRDGDEDVSRRQDRARAAQRAGSGLVLAIASDRSLAEPVGGAPPGRPSGGAEAAAGSVGAARRRRGRGRSATS